MAGDWIPMSTDLKNAAEVTLLHRVTGRSRFEIVGILHSLWSWAQAQTATGTLSRICPRDLVEVVGADLEFWEAMIDVEWLVVVEDDRGRPGLFVPNFDRWLGKGAKTRLYEREKKRKQREQAAGNVPQVSPQTGDKLGTKPGPQDRTEESLRKEKENAGASTPEDDRTNPPDGDQWSDLGTERPGPDIRTEGATRFPRDAKLGDEHRAIAGMMGVPADRVEWVWGDFCDRQWSTDLLSTDWLMNWRRWCRRAATDKPWNGPPRQVGGKRASPPVTAGDDWSKSEVRIYCEACDDVHRYKPGTPQVCPAAVRASA